MSGAFQLQSLEDEEASTWECVDIDGQITGWNTDPNKCSSHLYLSVKIGADNPNRPSWELPSVWQLYKPQLLRPRL
jgi:hypothetical protein